MISTKYIIRLVMDLPSFYTRIFVDKERRYHSPETKENILIINLGGKIIDIQYLICVIGFKG